LVDTGVAVFVYSETSDGVLMIKGDESLGTAQLYVFRAML
jgi:hypothetical protein